MSHSFDWRCDACERPNQHDFVGGETSAETGAGATGAGKADGHVLICDNCGRRQAMAEAGFDAGGALRDPLEACLACGSNKLYTQKDFNRKLGLAVVVVGAALSPWTYGLSLVACMAFDYGLYHFVPEITVCYACDAIHRGFTHNPAHRAHDPLLSERFRREARAELSSK
jgi:hypothetical protein